MTTNGGAERRLSTQGDGEVARVAVLTLVLLYPCFFSVLPRGLGAGAFMLGCSVVCLFSFGTRWRDKAPPGTLTVIWCALAIFAPVSAAAGHGTIGYAVPLLSLAIFAAIAGSTYRGWVATAFRILVAMCLVHAMATIAFYALPGLYDSLIRPRFFRDSITLLDYRSALTANRAYNATYCAVGFLVTATAALAAPASKLIRRVPLPLVFLFALLLADKRAHLIYSVLALVVMALTFRSRKVRARSIFAVVSGIVVTVWLASTYSGVGESLDRLMGTFDAHDAEEALSGRPLLWRAALDGWSERPLFGWGWGSFTFNWPNGTTVSVIAHNQPLNTAYEGGVVGLTLVVAATLGSVAFTLRNVREATAKQDKRPERATLLSTSLAIQLYFLFYSFTGGELLSKPYTFVIYLMSVGAAFSLASWAPVAGRGPAAATGGLARHSLGSAGTPDGAGG